MSRFLYCTSANNSQFDQLEIFRDIISTTFHVGILWWVVLFSFKFMGLCWINKVVQCMIVKKIRNKPRRIKRIGWLAISSVGSKFYSMASVSSVKIYNWLEYYHVEVCTQIYRVFLVVPNTCKSISDIILHNINNDIFTTNLKRQSYQIIIY